MSERVRLTLDPALTCRAPPSVVTDIIPGALAAIDPALPGASSKTLGALGIRPRLARYSILVDGWL